MALVRSLVDGDYETRYKERVVNNLVKKAQELGYILVQQEGLIEGVS